jgi:N-sulfoglucosamine sulfohydrolase
MPTFLELANLPRESYLPGHSLVPIFKGQETEGREHVFSAYNSHTTGEEMYWPVRTVNNGRFKLIHNLLPRIGIEKRLGKVGMNPRIEGSFKQSKKLITNTLQPGEFELYDLENDNSESNNLVTQAEYQEVFRNLQKELKHWREKVVKDPFIQNQTLKEFTDQYYRNCKEWREKMYQGGKSNFSKNKIFLSADGWRLNMKKWIPKWNPNDYKNELIKLGK